MSIIETIAASLASAVIGGAIGALATHLFALAREKRQKRRDLKLSHLIEAWRNISLGSQNHLDIETRAPALERGIADINLFGSRSQIELARAAAIAIVEKGEANTTEILNSVRSDIRQELGLENVKDTPFFFTLTPRTKMPSTPLQGVFK
jgi:hypothetical protein